MDRTLEFSKFVTEHKLGYTLPQHSAQAITDKNTGNINNNNLHKEDASREAFHQLTIDISKGIQDSAQSLSKLTKLVRQQGLFDDPTEEINKLIYKLKQDLNDLNFKCDAAQQNVDERKHQLGERNQGNAHSSSVVSQLKSGLMAATKDFKTALEVRSSKMKDTQNRKSQITGTGMLSPLRQFGGVNQNKNTGGESAEKKQQSGMVLPTPYNRNTVNKGHEGYVEESEKVTYNSPQMISMQQQQLLLAPPISQQYYESREEAVTEVEKTIGELGTLFKRLGTMLMEQQELVERIDEDVENAVSTADKAHTVLMKTYDSVSSNRGLYTKVISILVLFIVFFSIFLM